MISYRITKFNPDNRGVQGSYLDRSEWNSISDIGKPEYNNVTYEEYKKVENSYVNSVKLILQEKGITSLEIDSIEIHLDTKDFESFRLAGQVKSLSVDYEKDIKSLKNGMSLYEAQIEKIIRLILREFVWMNLLGKDIKIEFGYDYYMYIECNQLTASTIASIEQKGIFVEPHIGRWSVEL